MSHRSPGAWIAPALLGVVAGTAVQLQQPALWEWPSYALLLASGLALCCLPLRGRVGVGAVRILTAAAFLAFALTGLRSLAFEARALDPALEGRDIAVTGIVASLPQRSELGTRFRFEVEAAPVPLPPRLLLGWYGSDSTQAPVDLQAGDRWKFTVRLKAPHGNLNPHGFDYELWLWEQGLQATGYVRAGRRDPGAVRLAQTWAYAIDRARQRVRDAVFVQVEDRQLAGVIAALVMGDQAAIDRADWDVFRATGVAHLMSISGLHITMFAWAASLLVGGLWRRSARLCLAWPAQHAGLAGGVLLATAYALFSGWGVPAQRTIWMLAAVALLRWSGRQWPWPHVWLAACAVVVAIDPWALLQPGFWLSFVAVGVLFAAGPGPHVQPDVPTLKQRVLRSIGAALREQWVVTLALTPLTLLMFGQVSLVGLFANALAIPWVTLVVTPLAMAGVAFAPAWNIAAGAVSALSAFLHWLAGLPFATWSTAAAPVWAGAAGVAGGLLLVMRLPPVWRAFGVPLLLPVLLWQPQRPPSGEFELLAADVGQGNAIVVRTAGHTLVYDSGPRYGPESDAGHRVLVPLLRAFDDRVDTLLLSHSDSDHTGGAVAVLRTQPQAALLSSIAGAHELQGLRPATRCAAGQRWAWDGVEFQVLHPAGADYDAGGKPNAVSCVLRVSNGRSTALLPGDIELAQESRLVAQDAALRADVLLVPHHGSKTSSSGAFLDVVAPKVAIAQAGYRNRFGHPAAPVLERYRERGIAVALSAACGAARWRSSQPDAVHCERQAAGRYWHHRVP